MMEAYMISETLSFGASVTRMIAREYFGEFVLSGFSFNDPTAGTASLSKVCVCGDVTEQPFAFLFICTDQLCIVQLYAKQEPLRPEVSLTHSTPVRSVSHSARSVLV
jgi:hypothetical protein